jgi:uncharacterized RDD family membrane protein YckC
VAAPPATIRVSAEPVPYAGIVTRAVAFVVDLLLAQIVTITAGLVTALVGTLVDVAFDTFAQALAAAGWSLLVGGYFIFFWTVTGQTPGMRLMRLRVTDAGGGALRLTRALVRLGGLGLALIPLGAGLLPILTDERRRGLHDMLAKTVVLYAP